MSGDKDGEYACRPRPAPLPSLLLTTIGTVHLQLKDKFLASLSGNLFLSILEPIILKIRLLFFFLVVGNFCFLLFLRTVLESFLPHTAPQLIVSVSFFYLSNRRELKTVYLGSACFVCTREAKEIKTLPI